MHQISKDIFALRKNNLFTKFKFNLKKDNYSLELSDVPELIPSDLQVTWCILFLLILRIHIQHASNYASNLPSVLETPEGSNISRHLFCVGEVSVTFLANLSIPSCTVMLHYFMRPKSQNVIHVSRKTGVRGADIFISIGNKNVPISQNCIC